MTLEQLRTFRAVARLNSFTRAAEELHLTQPAVSAQIVGLENALRVKLFDRIGRGIALTPAGQLVLATAGDVLQHLDELRQSLDDLEGLRRGRLRLGASLVVGVYLLPEVLGAFKKEHPQIDLALRIEYAHHIVDLIMSNELDLGIIGEGAPLTDERLALKPLLGDELVVITPARHRWAGRDTISPTALTEEPFIIPARDFATSEIIQQRLTAAGLKLKPSLELGNIEAVKKAVEAGLGISIVSRCAIQHELEDGRLQRFRVHGVPLERQFFYCWRNGRRLSKAAQAFVEFFLERAGPRTA
jgi:DNA-binding transcriptional LysR family regulator